MKNSDVKKLSVEKRFLYWIEEREKIRLAKEAGEPRPWTDNEILSTYRFCNVRRMDDRVSQWLMKNWYEPNFDHHNMLSAVMLGRLFNLPQSLEELGFPIKWNPKRIKQVMHRRKDAGLKNFNAAYIVSTNGLTGDKVDILVDRVLRPARALKWREHTRTLEGLSRRLTDFWGISTFMAGQITADLRWAAEGKWRDRKRWAPIGPGSRRGINRLRDRPVDASVNKEQWDVWFYEFRMLVEKELPHIYNRLEAIDLQNCLCENWKMEKTLFNIGSGRPKQKYKERE